MKNFKVLFVYPNKPMLGVIPNNLAILSACLKKAGFKTKLFDASIYKTNSKTQDEIRADLNQVKKTNINDFIKYKNKDIFKDFVNTVKKYQPNLIAITLVDDTLELGFSLLEKIKDLNIPKIAGGIAVTFGYKKILKSNLINMVCIGEGEEALVELCEKLFNNKDFSHIKNIYTKKDNTIIKNPLRPLIDINKLPYSDFSIFKDFRFYRPFHGKVIRMAPIDTDRGCPYSCSYCAAPNIRKLYNQKKIGQYFRVKTIDKVFDEMKYVVKKHKITHIWFSSETFFAKSDAEISKFAQRYINEINLPFWCQTRLDTFTDKRTKLLKQMGCQSISVGLEHGDEEFRKNILKKYISNKQIIQSFKFLHKYKIQTTVNNIIGFPDETRNLIFETISLNRKISKFCYRGSTTNTFIFTPYSGTPLRKLCLEKGYLDNKLEIDNSLGMYKNSVLKMSSLSRKEIEGLAKTIPLYIKLPKLYFPKIKIAEKNNLQGKRMFVSLSKLFQHYT